MLVPVTINAHVRKRLLVLGLGKGCFLFKGGSNVFEALSMGYTGLKIYYQWELNLKFLSMFLLYKPLIFKGFSKHSSTK